MLLNPKRLTYLIIIYNKQNMLRPKLVIIDLNMNNKHKNLKLPKTKVNYKIMNIIISLF